MSYIVIEDYDGTSALPTKEDGSKWTHAILQDNYFVAADTAHELLSLTFIEDYHLIPDGEDGDLEALKERYAVATQIATMAQVKAVREYVEAGGELKELDEEIINSAFAPRTEPIPLEGPTWNGPFDLIAIATNYAPFRPGLKPPKGNVVLINPYTDTTLLTSLAEVGACQYWLYEGEDDFE